MDLRLPLLLLAAARAAAAVTVTFTQEGADTVARATGSFDDLSGIPWTGGITTTLYADYGVRSVMPHLGMAASEPAPSFRIYQRFPGMPAYLGTEDSVRHVPTYQTGTHAFVLTALPGIREGFRLLLPQDYAEGTPLDNVAVWSDATFADLGLAPGDYPFYWVTDTLTLSVVPESSTYGLILGALALAGAAARRQRRPD